MEVSGDHEQRVLAENPVHGLWIARLEQPLLVLEDERVQLVVAGDYGRRPEEMGLEYLTVPAQALNKIISSYIASPNDSDEQYLKSAQLNRKVRMPSVSRVSF